MAAGEGLQAADLSPDTRGTMRAYHAYKALMERAGSYCQRNKLRCPAELTPQLIGLEGKRVEVVDRYGECRRFIVGKTTGSCQPPGNRPPQFQRRPRRHRRNFPIGSHRRLTQVEQPCRQPPPCSWKRPVC